MQPVTSVPDIPASTRLPVEVAVLGDVATRRDGALVPLAGARARSLLVALARRPGRRRSVAALVEDVWGEEPPKSPANALHTQISRLRAVLPYGVLESGTAGYRLTLTAEQVDLARARQLARAAGEQHADGDHLGAIETVQLAGALWRGEPGADLSDGDLARELVSEAASYRDALAATELTALFALGEFERALPKARAVADAAPLDEGAHAVLMECLRGGDRSNEALEVFAGLRDRLADRLGTDPSPRLVDLNAAILRGGAEPALRAVRDDVSATRAYEPGMLPNVIGLRAAPNRLFGRTGDLAALESLLECSRVVTVLGPGGTGKTRVVHALGARMAGRMPVVLVELASLRSGEDLMAAISSTLGLSENGLTPGALTGARIHDSPQRLRDALSAAPTLLILDNCEHLIDDVAEVVSDLIGASDQLTVLATSRSPMSITSEAVYPLPPLAIGDETSPAAELFRARALAVRPSARLDPAEVTQLCRTLDGLPLAIELAAARVRTMSVEEINARLVDRFALLRSRDRTSPARHRTLRAVIEWSWNLLEESERAALRRLCRFPSGFTLDAATALAQWDGVDDVADALEGLANQSMLSVVEPAEGTDSVGLRYHMLETVLEFGEEQLLMGANSSEAEEVQRRTVRWAEQLSQEAVRDFFAGKQISVARLVRAEHDNLRVVLRHALAERQVRTALTVFPVLGGVWAGCGAPSEVSAWAPRLLDLDGSTLSPDEVPGDHLAISYVLAAMNGTMNGNVRTMALARTRLRRLLAARPDISEQLRIAAALILTPAAGRGLARLLATAVRSDDPDARILALVARSSVRENNGDLHGSESDAKRALTLTAEPDSWHHALLSQHLGRLCAQSGRYAEAIAHYRRSAEGLWKLHLYDESLQVRGFMVAALVGGGQIAQARAELARLRPAHRGGLVHADDPHNQASLAMTTAEADLAAGFVDRGLAEYRRAAACAGDLALAVGVYPYEVIVAAAAIDAHVLAGRIELIADLADRLPSVAVVRLGPGGYPDLPQTGAVACAVGAVDIVTGRDPGRGLRLLALATRVAARQDCPSMRLDRHLTRARTLLGGAGVATALTSVERTPRAAAHREILDILAGLDS
ncbi:AfsR/SARP family transcriptional regulator [Rhodococcus marinonascens]|uniref:AfsR/SARP family transcriptional regulator n=1 Tax=Rhodococcus marinonascens TaxID=38311 RepID=UPI000AED1C58|nr:BTAD domain-containing putative transcriptional regulator [Rhodococcus marinonascens]